MYAGKQFVPRSYSRLAYPGFRPVPLNPGETQIISGGYGEMSEGAAVAGAIGIGVAGLVVTVGMYVLLAYGIAWGAGKGWARAKKGRK